MQLNLTLADAIAALILGILGSVIATYFWKRFPGWFSWLANWFAARSKKSAKARTAKLRKRVKFIDELNKRPSMHLGMLAENLSQMVFSSFFATIGLLVSLCFLIGLLVLRYSAGVLPGRYEFVLVLSLLFTWLVFSGFLFSESLTIRRYANLQRYRQHLMKQIAQLNMRVKRK